MNTSSLESSSQELNDDINYINGLLNNFGLEEFPFKTIFSPELSGSKFVMLDNKARVCSILIQLLHSKQKEEIFRRDSEDRSGRLIEEIRNLEIQQKRQDERVKLQERELIGHRQNHQISTEKQRNFESSARSLRDEVNKLKQIFAQKDRQFQHEIRKKEKEFEKLKDQLASVLKDMQLREQKSEIQYNSQQSAILHVDMEIGLNEDELLDQESNVRTDRNILLEVENNQLRQILSFNYASLAQLVIDLFPELELDQSILGFLEISPLDWIEETLAQKIEELFEILRANLVNLAEKQQQKSVNQEQENSLINLSSQIKTANSTIAAQAEMIKSLEQKLVEMKIYSEKVESLEIEKSRLQDLLSRNEKNENNKNSIPSTPKWMKISRDIK